MPGVGRYPCKSCHYVANNRRMLARHTALMHLEKAFRCPLCPFITKYAANWYRHKRDLHGLTKLTTCETCGFFARSTPELAQHREEEHPELLQLDKFEDKYAKEKIRLTEGSESRFQELETRRDVRNEPDLLLDIYDIDQEIDIHIPPENDEVSDEREKYPPSSNGHLSADVEEGSSNSISKESSPESTLGKEMETSTDNLRPLRIRRSYNCDQCGLLTNNPREYLYHLRSVHGEKIAVHECKYCIYASKHIQKLQRHCNLVHRQQMEKDSEFKRQIESSKERKGRSSEAAPVAMPSSRPSANENFRNSGLSNKLPVKSKAQGGFFKCNICNYQTRNKTLMFHHEKTAHLKTKKNFRCTECNYVTSEKARFTKHIKYHNLPKLQCNFCFFKTAYKWNMDRHMKNHEVGAEGNFHCSECNFTTCTKQSYNAHVTHHHDPTAMETEDQDVDEQNGENDSNEWEDINVVDCDEDDDSQGNEGNFDDYEFSEASENPDPIWKQGKPYQRNLKCQQCDFRAAWPFELKKHEENHRSQKKHPCPMCGMRFEHVAWLIKHLRRIHGENPQAKSLAAAFDVMKPARRRPGKEYAIDNVLPAFQDVLKQNNMQSSNGNSSNKNADASKSSMLSTLLKKPLHSFAPQSSVSKYSASLKSKNFGASSSVFKQPRISNYYQKVVPAQETPEIKSKSTVPTCNICNYKTRWISELQRHMRVHSQEKPFQCHKCKYVCKWKGDLNRHLLKYHGIKMPSTKRSDLPKYSMKRSSSDEPLGEWQGSGPEKRNPFGPSTSVRSSEESPLDLTLCRETFPHPDALSPPYDAYDFESQSAMDGDLDAIDVGMNSRSPLLYSDYNKSPVPQSDEHSLDNTSSNSAVKMNGMRYQCPRCPFTTTTVSRFHVHIVQHSNKRPFMCSVCGYNSNWEWDITKHIRIKGCRDKDYNKACVLMTDECGRRNYEKYDKYLIDSAPAMSDFQSREPEASEMQENQNVKFSTPRPSYGDASSKTCSYDFRNIGSNFEDGPVNIVVTPDIPLPDNPDPQENQDGFSSNQVDSMEDDASQNMNGASNSGEAKYFFCKHCDFKHSTKRVVVSHLSTHAGLKPFRCRACGITSNWRHVIVRHVKDVHNGYMNVVEERINYVQEGFVLRLISVAGDNDSNRNNDNDNDDANADVEKSSDQCYGCKICPYKCDKEFYMNFHMKQHRPREGAVFKCDYCPYFVKFKKTLVRHMKLHNPPASSNANESSSAKNSEDQPKEFRNDVYDFYDGQNNEDQSNDDSIAISFNQLSQVDPAEVSPQKIKRHVCEHCPYKTDNKTQYLYHKQFHRPNPSAPFKCNVCTYWATMQHLLTQHMRVHAESSSSEQEQNENSKNGPKQFFEFFDDKSVPEKISVIYVKKGEETVKMFKCEFCPMMNKKKANVRVHQKMHGVVINDGRYACSYCNYQCLNQGGLTNHMKVHQKNLDHELFNRFGDGDESPRKFLESFEDEINPVVRRRTSAYFCFKCPGIFKTANDLENHSKFHGCTLPLKCMYCDYRAKHKPHITQHLAVHTAEYKTKRKASQPMNASSQPLEETLEENKEVVPPKKIDQMLLLEASELKAALKKSGDSSVTLHKCIFCPASFFKTSILVYHAALHGSDGEFKCSQCDYAVTRPDNLAIHSLVHPKKSPVKRSLKTFLCPKCPAVFYKQDRHERHLDLHGKNYRFACDQCDYSVRFAANLIKHKKVHATPRDPDLVDSSVANENAYQSPQGVAEYVAAPEVEEKRITYICDRCPYYQMRKDAVQSHQRRHWLKDGFECPYCDYSSMQNSFLQSHMKLHIQPSNLFPPQAFMKFESFKIYIKDDNGDEQLLFDDETMVKKRAQSDEEERIDVETVEGEHTPEPGELAESKTTDSEEIQKLLNEMRYDSHTDSNLSSSSSRSNKVPIVVLNDIFANKDLKKWDPKLKIPKLKISKKFARSSSSERSYKKLKISDSPHRAENPKVKKPSSKPSLVVKIKVENRVSKHEKTLYSVSKLSDEHLLKDKENSLESAENENTNDSTSDMMLEDSNPPVPAGVKISPVEDIEENTLTSNPDMEERLRNADDASGVEDIVDSIVGSTNDDLLLSRSTDENVELKSNDSFSNDTVPAVSDILCDKLDCLTDLSFKDSDLSLTNGDCSNHLASSGLNLLPEEIKVSL